MSIIIEIANLLIYYDLIVLFVMVRNLDFMILAHTCTWMSNRQSLNYEPVYNLNVLRFNACSNVMYIMISRQCEDEE